MSTVVVRKPRPVVCKAPKPAKRRITPIGNIDISSGTDVHRLILRLLSLGVVPDILARATGVSKRTFAAFRAHETLGTYRNK